MKAVVLFLIVGALSLAAANRSLHQAPSTAYNRTAVPVPAPAPGNCPAKKNPGPSCVTEATAFQTSCSGYIQALVKATGGSIVATTDDQITALVGGLKSNGSAPTAGCCTASRALLSDACVCDTSVQAVARAQQNFTPAQFQTVGKVFLNACGFPSCTDTCVLTA